jgi:hypothetical protein
VFDVSTRCGREKYCGSVAKSNGKGVVNLALTNEGEAVDIQLNFYAVIRAGRMRLTQA